MDANETLCVGIDLGTSRSSVSASNGERHVVDSYVGPYTSVGSGCEIVRSEVEHSVLLERSRIIDVPRLQDSLIGREAVVTRSAIRPARQRRDLDVDLLREEHLNRPIRCLLPGLIPVEQQHDSLTQPPQNHGANRTTMRA